MRKIIVGLCCTLLVYQAKGQQLPRFNAQLEEVLVYKTGASLSHSAKITLPAGASELIIDNVAGTIDENTIQVSAPSNVTILSVLVNKNQEMDTRQQDTALYNPAQKKINAAIKEAQLSLQKVLNRIAAYDKSLSLLEQNQVISSPQNGVNAAELGKLAEMYLVKQIELRDKLSEQRQQEKELNEKVSVWHAELTALGGKMPQQQLAARGQLKIQLMSSTAMNSTIQLSYLSNAATWSAAYDIKADNLNEPINLVYKANIQQNTGLDWNKVKLALSTGNPTIGNVAPLLATWYLQFGQPAAYGASKDEVVVNTIQASASDYRMRAKAAPRSLDDYVSTQQSPVATTFNIDLPYNIASNYKVHAVALQTHELNTVYKHYAVPRLDPDVFLLAELTDLESLNLIPGPANILFENKFVGKTVLNPYTTEDTINVSIGRDKRIIVKREKVSEQSGVKTLGAHKKQTFVYELTVKNGKSEKVELILKDQIPTSTDNAVEIELINADNASRNPDNGVLTWRLNLKPGEIKKVKFTYSVKYPKGRVINNL
ncbi:MAG: mucoidy inhibitor MuiA family protein [Sphingobacteriales bacterium]|nr:MAG: mucoidy inhibitor MuiA family protein [Sphingobacteriales bacterium]